MVAEYVCQWYLHSSPFAYRSMANNETLSLGAQNRAARLAAREASFNAPCWGYAKGDPPMAQA